MRRAGIVALAVAALLLAACGERPQVVRYKQGTYQGKPDTPPYDAQFKGNRGEWENALATRNQAQNEYKKVQ
jgi:major membrane immunogen (membrane-anchored lipoprotein)